jgi:LysM repeat protein
MRELISANPQLLKSGDALTIPVAVSIPAESANNSGGGASEPRTYTVKPGDSLYVIAIKYGTTVAALASLNNIADPNNIKIGQVLNIP